MEIFRKKNQATRIVFPLINSSSRPDYYTGSLTGAVVSGVSWQDGQAAASYSITDTPSQVGTIGLWELSLTQSEMNPDTGSDDYIAVYINGTEVDQQTVLIQLQSYDSKTELAQSSEIDNIANSGAGWVTATSVGLTPSALSNIVSSGNTAGWADGATAAEVWANGTRDLTNYNESAIASEVTASGTAAGFDSVADLTATNAKIDDIAGSGTSWVTATGFSTHSAADVWTAATRSLTESVNVSGIDNDVITAAVIANDAITAPKIAADAITAGKIADATFQNGMFTADYYSRIVDSGNAAGWDTTSSLTKEAIAAEVVLSGNANNWDLYSDATAANQSSILSSIDNIAASGTNWTTADTSTLATQSSLDVAHANISGLPTLDEMYSFVISGTGGNEVRMSGAIKDILAYSHGTVVHSGISADTYTNLYQDEDGGSLWTATITPSGRTIS